MLHPRHNGGSFHAGRRSSHRILVPVRSKLCKNFRFTPGIGTAAGISLYLFSAPNPGQLCCGDPLHSPSSATKPISSRPCPFRRDPITVPGYRARGNRYRKLPCSGCIPRNNKTWPLFRIWASHPLHFSGFCSNTIIYIIKPFASLSFPPAVPFCPLCPTHHDIQRVSPFLHILVVLFFIDGEVVYSRSCKCIWGTKGQIHTRPGVGLRPREPLRSHRRLPLTAPLPCAQPAYRVSHGHARCRTL